MPTSARRRTATSDTPATAKTETSPGGTVTDEPAVAAPTAAAGDAATGERPSAPGPAGGEKAATWSDAGHSLRRVVTMPVTVTRAVADDVISTLRRPDAALYIGGLAGLAALGILEWPAAAAIGVGVAVAGGRNRTSTAAQPAG
jgi:hypothetical protein